MDSQTDSVWANRQAQGRPDAEGRGNREAQLLGRSLERRVRCHFSRQRPNETPTQGTRFEFHEGRVPFRRFRTPKQRLDCRRTPTQTTPYETLSAPAEVLSHLQRKANQFRCFRARCNFLHPSHVPVSDVGCCEFWKALQFLQSGTEQLVLSLPSSARWWPKRRWCARNVLPSSRCEEPIGTSIQCACKIKCLAN
jgi:hypothetical protein